MNENQKESFRAALLKQRSDMRAEMLSHGRGDGADNRNLEERASNLAEQSVEDRIAGDDQQLLAKIDLALERLAAGTFEECASCGGRIPLERLLAKPSVSLCVTCQEAHEARSG